MVNVRCKDKMAFFRACTLTLTIDTMIIGPLMAIMVLSIGSARGSARARCTAFAQVILGECSCKYFISA